MRRLIALLPLICTIASPAIAFDNGWSFIARNPNGVVMELARHSMAGVRDVSAAVIRFRPTRGDDQARSYAIAADCSAGTMLVAPVSVASGGTANWLLTGVDKASFRLPVERSSGSQIVARLCRTDGPGNYAPTGITLSMTPPVNNNGFLRN